MGGSRLAIPHPAADWEVCQPWATQSNIASQLPGGTPPPAVSEEEQKEEVARSALSTLSATLARHSAHSSPRLSGAMSHGGGGDAAASSGNGLSLPPAQQQAAGPGTPRPGQAAAPAVPFTPITLICRGIRCVPSPALLPPAVHCSLQERLHGLPLELFRQPSPNLQV